MLNIQDRTFESLWSANTRKPTIEKSRGACTAPRSNIVQHVLARVALLNSTFLPQHFNIVHAFYYTRLITLLNYLISLKITKKKHVYQTRESSNHCNTLPITTNWKNQNIRESHVSSLPRVFSPQKSKTWVHFTPGLFDL